MNNKKVFLIILTISFLAIAAVSLKNNVSPYVSIKEAMDKPKSHVQIIGDLHKKTVIYDAKGYSFIISDETKSDLKVYKDGIKPMNFEHSEQVVLIGSYNNESGVFIADKVLTKCPSRYSGEK